MGVEVDLNPILTSSVHGCECNATRLSTGIWTTALTLEIFAFLLTGYLGYMLMTLTINSVYISEQQ
jgi:hypothetical protein